MLCLIVKYVDEKEIECLLKEIEVVILECVGEFFYGYDDIFFVKEFFKVCKEKGFMIFVVESFIGGLFFEWLMDFSGVLK